MSREEETYPIETVSVVISGPAAQVRLSGGRFSFSTSSNFAEFWFTDALREATEGPQGDIHARRREIVFSVICAESYIVEWAITQVMMSPVSTTRSYSETHDVLRTYFPTGRKSRSVSNQWKKVPRELVRDGHLESFALVGPLPCFRDFERLIEMRNDVTHANVSHLEVHAGVGKKQQPLTTTVTDLAQLTPGWATATVAERIRALHQQVGTSPPDWITAAIIDQDESDT